MKSFQLLKNKFIRLTINIIFIPVWFYLSNIFLFKIYEFIIYLPNGVTPFFDYPSLMKLRNLGLIAILIVPPILLTKFIWFPKRQKITSSKD
tara:strand:+ start:211 stop:486 length:276 start_codon:yes stop_codon:yes gene_type:complete